MAISEGHSERHSDLRGSASPTPSSWAALRAHQLGAVLRPREWAAVGLLFLAAGVALLQTL